MSGEIDRFRATRTIRVVNRGTAPPKPATKSVLVIYTERRPAVEPGADVNALDEVDSKSSGAGIGDV